MSVSLHLVERGYWEDHPDWREHALVNGGYKHFVRNVLSTLPKEEIRSDDSQYDFEWLTRPTDFAAWRAAIAADPQLSDINTLPIMIDVLEANPNRWLYVSQ